MLVRALLGIVLSLLAGLGFSSQDSKPAGAPPGGVHPTQAWHVLFETGAKYDSKVDAMQQPGFAGHFAFVHKMAEEGDLLVGGPLLEKVGEGKITGAVMILRGKDEKALREKLAGDPFVSGEVIKVASVRPMMVGAGAWLPKEKAPGR